ncbi:hypothetical protein [Legionella tunisiensis]|uniref:hypothetical protein n=1 Tax=Legionella tunisiensis TaxID=1034944 RepID=UPI0002DE185F|nr:hypothetical protein [Legionella tunisiensis]
MITVNIWLPTAQIFGKKINHNIFAPLVATQRENENVGHANFQLTLDERSNAYEQLLHSKSPLVDKTLRVVPTLVKGKERAYYTQEN